jgi:hypothetical protein
VSNPSVALTRKSDGEWLTCVVALPPMLWLYQHKGNWWSTKRKITLTVVNFVVVVLGITIVRKCSYSDNIVVISD